MRRIALILLLGIAALAGFALEANAAIVLGTAGNFAILGGSAVTNIGSTVINNGNVGNYPTPAVTGFPPGVVNNGTLYLAADPVTAQAHTDLITAYTAAQTASGGTAGPANLGGASLAPGVYTYSSAATWTSGPLTLNGGGDPNAQWIFQIGSTLITPAYASVVLLDGASPDHVFWQVGSSATIGATNTFAGNILALASIDLGGGTLDGRALAIDGTVTISAAETVNVPEPATMSLLAVGGLALLRRKR